MNEHTAFYQHQKAEGLKLPQWLSLRKSQALSQLEQQPFPTRHDEDWKYTPVQG